MSGSDQQKLLEAGFKIIRPVRGEMRSSVNKNISGGIIKIKTAQNKDWIVFEKGFESNAALEKRVKELLRDKMIVSD